MKKERVRSLGASSAQKQRWGPMICVLREQKNWTQAYLIRQYYKQVEKHTDEESDEDHTLPEAWLRRAEKGVGVKCSRFQLERFCDALETSIPQRWDMLSAAGFDFFADADGNVSEEGELLKYTFGRILESKEAKRVLQRHIIRNGKAPINGQELDSLLDAMQVAIEELRKQRNLSLSPHLAPS